MSRSVRVMLQMVGTLVLPFVLLGVYTALAGSESFLTWRVADTVVFCLSVLVGLACIVTAPAEVWVRVLVGFVYVPAMTFALFIYLLFHVCEAYDRCL